MGMLKTSMIAVGCGLAVGFGTAWAERHFHWHVGRGGDLLDGAMVAAGVIGCIIFYRIVRKEMDDDPWSDLGPRQ